VVVVEGLQGTIVETALNTHSEAIAAGRPAETGIGATRRRLQPGTAWLLSSLTVDASMLAIAAAGTALGGAVAGIQSPPAMWMAIFAVLCIALYAKRGLYAPRLRLRAIDDVSSVVVATTRVRTKPLRMDHFHLLSLTDDSHQVMTAGYADPACQASSEPQENLKKR